MKKDISSLKGEFIGLIVEVTVSDNLNNIGLKGKIINETKNTSVIKTKKGGSRGHHLFLFLKPGFIWPEPAFSQ